MSSNMKVITVHDSMPCDPCDDYFVFELVRIFLLFRSSLFNSHLQLERMWKIYSGRSLAILNLVIWLMNHCRYGVVHLSKSSVRLNLDKEQLAVLVLV